MLEGLRNEFLESFSFDLDPFQERSFSLLEDGESVLVAAPTGSGKTLVGLYAIFKALKQGGRAFYTTPLKALSNQKYMEFCGQFGVENVGLLTGDNTIRSDAAVVVMTTEVLRNMIYAQSQDLSQVTLVVLDEVHYLQNPYRGAVWEEVIIHLPQHVSLVCLSATVSNAEEFASWMKTVRGSMEAVIEERRPVDIEHLYLFGDKRNHHAAMIPTFVAGRPNPDGADLDAPWLAQGAIRRGGRLKAFPPRRPEVVDLLSAEGMLPAIYFIFSRAGCDEAVREVLHSGLRLTSQMERAQIRKIVDEHLDILSDSDLHALRYKEFIGALEAGVAAHHAGMVPPFREVVEACFERALIKVVFATETLALGINMPARSVVVEKLTKFNGERHEILSGGEYTQLSGRAGRRGKDDIGFCLVLWNSATTFEQTASLAQTRSYPISSSFRPTYNMATNLIKRYDSETARHLLNLSFAQFGSDSEVVEMEAELSRTRRRLEGMDEDIHCDYGDVELYLSLLAKAEEDRAKRIVIRKPIIPTIRFNRLRVGDVLSVPLKDGGDKRTKLLVTSIGYRGKSKIKLSAVATTGRSYRIGTQFEPLTRVEGTVSLPRPYLPNSKEFKAIAAQILSDFQGPSLEGGDPDLLHIGGDKGTSQAPELVAMELMLSRCPAYNEHLSAARRRRRLSGRAEELTQKIRAKIESLAIQLDRVLEVLTHYGYVDDWALSDAGQRLSRIYSEADLLCSLALERGLLDGLDPPSLASILAMFTYESRPNFKDADEHPTKAVSKRARQIARLWSELAETESLHRLPITKEPQSGFGLIIYRWAKGYDLARTLEGFTVPPGDFVRNAKQTVDLLRQVAEVALSNQTRLTARRAIECILRGVVAISSQVYTELPVPSTEDAEAAKLS